MIRPARTALATFRPELWFTLMRPAFADVRTRSPRATGLWLVMIRPARTALATFRPELWFAESLPAFTEVRTPRPRFSELLWFRVILPARTFVWIFMAIPSWLSGGPDSRRRAARHRGCRAFS